MHCSFFSVTRGCPTTWLVAAFFLLFGGCATYQAKPLPTGPDLAPDLDRLAKPEAAPSTISGKGLSLAELAALAVRNNPDLKALRKQLGVQHAQLFSAGLLPDPQLAANLDHPTGNLVGTVNGYGIGLGYDIIPLIDRGARLDSARMKEQQVRLELLWQEWQVSQQARMLAVSLVSEEQQLVLLQDMKDLYRQRYRRSSEAVAKGDLTLGVAGTDLTALLDTLSQINQMEQSRNDTRHALNLLIGLAADTALEIILPVPPVYLNVQDIQQVLATLPQRRPDLLALQAGYQSQEAKVRAAILAQFPSLTIGITRARDTGGVYTAGFNIGLNLPLFSGNRGTIAVERATREQLRQEYQARIDQALVDVDKLVRMQGIVAAQQEQLDAYLPTLKELVEKGRRAYQNGDIDALTFLNMENTWIGKRLEQISLDQTQRNNRIALETLLALPVAGTQQATHAPQGDSP